MVVLVAFDPGLDERARRRSPSALGPDVVEGAPGQLATEALPLVGIVDLGVVEHERLRRHPVVREPRRTPST